MKKKTSSRIDLHCGITGRIKATTCPLGSAEVGAALSSVPLSFPRPRPDIEKPLFSSANRLAFSLKTLLALRY